MCRQYYECVDVVEYRFRNTLTDAHRDPWKGVLCISKLPKTDNSNTPIRSSGRCITIQRVASVLSSPEQLVQSIVAPSTPSRNRYASQHWDEDERHSDVDS